MSSLLFDILRSLHHIINAHSLENLKLASTVQRIIFLTKLSPLSTKAMPPSQNGMVNNWPQGFHGIFVVSNFVAFFITMTTDIFCKLTKIIFSVFSILCLKWEVFGNLLLKVYLWTKIILIKSCFKKNSNSFGKTLRNRDFRLVKEDNFQIQALKD